MANLSAVIQPGGVATLTGTQTLTNKTITAPVLGGNIDQTGSIRGGITTISALDIDCSLGNYFIKTIYNNNLGYA